ncbi:MAG: HAMP domain-containing sensor histidine kinase, partial [Desulfosarcinaceae bacterium]
KSLLDLSALEIEGAKRQTPVDLTDLMASLIPDYRFLAEARRIQIHVRLPEKLLVNGDAELLKRAFSNLLDNAVKYNVDGGMIDVAGTASAAEIKIIFGNTGAGIPEEEFSKVFEVFYRVEASRSLRYGGSGLGLAIVKRIVELHGGSVEFESRQGVRTQITVSLPLS